MARLRLMPLIAFICWMLLETPANPDHSKLIMTGSGKKLRSYHAGLLFCPLACIDNLNRLVPSCVKTDQGQASGGWHFWSKPLCFSPSNSWCKPAHLAAALGLEVTQLRTFPLHVENAPEKRRGMLIINLKICWRKRKRATFFFSMHCAIKVTFLLESKDEQPDVGSVCVCSPNWRLRWAIKFWYAEIRAVCLRESLFPAILCIFINAALESQAMKQPAYYDQFLSLSCFIHVADRNVAARRICFCLPHFPLTSASCSPFISFFPTGDLVFCCYAWNPHSQIGLTWFALWEAPLLERWAALCYQPQAEHSLSGGQDGLGGAVLCWWKRIFCSPGNILMRHLWPVSPHRVLLLIGIR